MIRAIVKDPLLLSKKSIDADVNDKKIITDLKDTLLAHKRECVGMAANMIGENKNIIIVSLGFLPLVMINPKIINRKGEYETMEGCLSLSGQRCTKRFKDIEVEYLDESLVKKRVKYNGYIAQIIQHEIDHTKGILI